MNSCEVSTEGTQTDNDLHHTIVRKHPTRQIYQSVTKRYTVLIPKLNNYTNVHLQYL